MINSLGFTGSSDDGMPTSAQKWAIMGFVYKLNPMHAHHGDCVNSDEEFHQVATYFRALVGNPLIHVHPPTNPKKRAFCKGDVIYTEAPYLKRNRNIVAMSDVLIATPHGPEEVRSGTWATIRYAKQKGIPIHIVYPN